MFRYDVINRLLSKHLSPTAQYLEIGVDDPRRCFYRIACANKTAVDPVNKFPAPQQVHYQMTSDEFFSRLRQGKTSFPADQLWDLIFIDGLHLAEQVYQDIQNALRHCQPNGFVVLHDCNPATHLNAHSDLAYFHKYQGEWNGSTWKAFYRFRTESSLRSYTVDTDYGVGVIELAGRQLPIQDANPWLEFGHFSQHRNEQIGLISVAEFRRRH